MHHDKIHIIKTKHLSLYKIKTLTGPSLVPPLQGGQLIFFAAKINVLKPWYYSRWVVCMDIYTIHCSRLVLEFMLPSAQCIWHS